MPAARVVSVALESPAQRAGLQVGDELLRIDGRAPRDVIEYQLFTDGEDPELEVRRGHEDVCVEVRKAAGEPLGIEVSSALFDRVRTCDNHCEFCFIHQLPKGMRKSLYTKDDDYRLSFLYGNFTTLTRFTELDLERVLSEHLSPLFVSIHSTDPQLRARMLRNPRGGTSLRWLRALLDGGIEVHGQVVVCPGVNDAEALETTLAGIADEYPELATVACVPLGISDHTTDAAMRDHTAAEAAAVIDLVEQWQGLYTTCIGRRMVYAADEYYLLAHRPFPDAAAYDGFPQHENGIGMARAFAEAFAGDTRSALGVRRGFFSWVDGARPEGYRALRSEESRTEPHRVGGCDSAAPTGQAGALGGTTRVPITLGPPSSLRTRAWRGPRTTTVITGEYGAQVIGPLLDAYEHRAGLDVRLLPVHNSFFGGNIAVTGLLTGVDIARALEREPTGQCYLLPDVCLSEGRFLDGMRLADLPRPVEVLATDGLSLRLALEAGRDTAGGDTAGDIDERLVERYEASSGWTR
jgi:putative radical SAM enzyme (TIGR03279 family)